MTDNETRWATRVAEWRASGQSAPAFCAGKGFSPGGLRYWASRLRKGGKDAEAKELRLARVVRAHEGATETPIVLEVGGARLGLKRGFDPEALRAVLGVLGAPR